MSSMMSDSSSRRVSGELKSLNRASSSMASTRVSRSKSYTGSQVQQQQQPRGLFGYLKDAAVGGYGLLQNAAAGGYEYLQNAPVVGGGIRRITNAAYAGIENLRSATNEGVNFFYHVFVKHPHQRETNIQQTINRIKNLLAQCRTPKEFYHALISLSVHDLGLLLFVIEDPTLKKSIIDLLIKKNIMALDWVNNVLIPYTSNLKHRTNNSVVSDKGFKVKVSLEHAQWLADQIKKQLVDLAKFRLAHVKYNITSTPSLLKNNVSQILNRVAGNEGVVWSALATIAGVGMLNIFNFNTVATEAILWNKTWNSSQPLETLLLQLKQTSDDIEEAKSAYHHYIAAHKK